MTTWDDLYKSVGYLISVFFSYTWVEFFSVLPLLALLLGLGFINLLLGSWGDQLVEGLDTNIRRLLSFLTGMGCALFYTAVSTTGWRWLQRLEE